MMNVPVSKSLTNGFVTFQDMTKVEKFAEATFLTEWQLRYAPKNLKISIENKKVKNLGGKHEKCGNFETNRE